MFFSPIPIIRKKHIIWKLLESDSVSSESAKSFAEAGVINPQGFKKITHRLLKDGVIVRTAEGKYYLA